jgi:hypothetical protein
MCALAKRIKLSGVSCVMTFLNELAVFDRLDLL